MVNSLSIVINVQPGEFVAENVCATIRAATAAGSKKKRKKNTQYITRYIFSVDLP